VLAGTVLHSKNHSDTFLQRPRSAISGFCPESLLQATEPDHEISIGAIAAAEAAAKAGNGPKALACLKNAGTWAFDVASKIGVNIASSALKGTLGLP